MNLVAICAEIADALATIGITAYDHTPEHAELPAAFVGMPDNIQYTQTMGGQVSLTVPLLVIVDDVENRYAQLRLKAALSTEDTRDTIEGLIESGDADGIWIGPIKPTLEAWPETAWSSLAVLEATDYGSYEIAGHTGLGVVLPLSIQSRRLSA